MRTLSAPKRRVRFAGAWRFAVAALAIVCAVPLAADSAKDKKKVTKVRVGLLTYAGGKTSQCFAPGFLDQIGRQTNINIRRKFDNVKLNSGKLHEYPFLVMTGEGPFKLSPKEIHDLRGYLYRGGFLLVSAGCSNADWAQSFRKAIKKVLPKSKLKKLEKDHPVFHTVYELKNLRTRKVTDRPVHLEGLQRDGRLVLLFSPEGLNDTANAGGGCCCCGGNELVDAKLINVNVLAYALTH